MTSKHAVSSEDVSASHPLDHQPPLAPSHTAPPTFTPDMTAEQAKALLADLTGSLPLPKSPPPRTRPLTEHRRKKREGQWVRHKGSKTQRPKDSFHYVDYRKTPTYKMHKVLQKALKVPPPTDTDPPLKGRTWERLWENIPNHETTLATLQKLAQSLPHDSIKLLKYGAEILTLQHLLSLRKSNWMHSSILTAWSHLLAMHDPTVALEHVRPTHLTWLRDPFFYDRLTGVRRHPSGQVLGQDGLSTERVQRETRKNPVHHLSRILVPINTDNTHFMVACLDVPRRLVILYDSYHQGNTQPIMDNLCQWAQSIYPASGN